MKQNKMKTHQYEKKFRKLFIKALLSTNISYLDLIEINNRAMKALVEVVRTRCEESERKL